MLSDALTLGETAKPRSDGIQDGVCLMFSTRDRQCAPSLESAGGGRLSSWVVNGLERVVSVSVTPCARE